MQKAVVRFWRKVTFKSHAKHQALYQTDPYFPQLDIGILNLLVIPNTAKLLRTTSLSRGNRTAPEPRHLLCPIGLLIVDKQLSFLDVVSRRFVRDLDDGESALETVHGAKKMLSIASRERPAVSGCGGMESVGLSLVMGVRRMMLASLCRRSEPRVR